MVQLLAELLQGRSDGAQPGQAAEKPSLLLSPAEAAGQGDGPVGHKAGQEINLSSISLTSQPPFCIFVEKDTIYNIKKIELARVNKHTQNN